MRKLAALRNRSPFAGDQPLDSISLCVYGDSTGLRHWNGNNDPMPINIAGGKTLEECVNYRGGGITVYTDNIVKVRTYEGFYDYFLANQRQMSEIMMLPSEEVVKDKEYYDKLVNGLALQYNQQIENAPNLLRVAQVLQDVNTPAPINFGCTVFPDGAIWTGEGYSVGTADKPPCPVDVPSGKLSFVTKATSETHSFIMKNRLGDNAQYQYFYWTNNIGGGSGGENTYTADLNVKDFLVSKLYSNITLVGRGVNYDNVINLGRAQGGSGKTQSFKQLLIYKGNLTEAELKAELAKTIRLR